MANPTLIIRMFVLLIFLNGCRQEMSTQPHQSNSGPEIVTGKYPAVSPDGQKLAFVNNEKIYISDITGGNIIQVTPGSIKAELPRWSYDGKSIGFVHYDPLLSSHNRLKRIDVATKAVSSITFTDTLQINSFGVFDWSWSPDNQHVAILSYSADKYFVKVVASNGSGLTIRRFLARQFSWNSSGNKLVCTYMNDQSISTVSIASIGNDSSMNIVSSGSAYQADWLPNSNRITYLTGTTQLNIFDLDSNRILSTDIASLNYKVSPDGKNIAFVYAYSSSNPDADTQYSINCINVATKERRVLITANRFLYFVWAPSSQEIFYGFNGKIFKAHI